MEPVILDQEVNENRVLARFFLWNGQALYVGRSPQSTFHRHNALQIGIGLDGPLRIRYQSTENYINCQNFIIAPNTSHQIAAAANALFLWIESESVIAHKLRTIYSNRDDPNVIDNNQISSIVGALQGADIHYVNCSQAASLVDRILYILAPGDSIPPAVDPRVKTAVQLIKDTSWSDEPYQTNTIAHQVYLSPSRLRHLFYEQIGISIQRYLLWQRLLQAIQLLAKGGALTQVAYETGFADSAHMTRTFRTMFGIKPSEIFKNSHFVQVFACPIE